MVPRERFSKRWREHESGAAHYGSGFYHAPDSKIRWPQGREGLTPFSGTNIIVAHYYLLTHKDNTMITALENFETLEFRTKHPSVYVVGFKSTDTFTPFYVGETGNLTCRCADYIRAQFKAPTDFRVGAAIKCLEARG